MLCIDDTKLDASFLDAQFHSEGYQYPSIRQYRGKNGWGKMIFIRESLIVKIDYMHTKIAPPKLYAWKSQCLKRNGL